MPLAAAPGYETEIRLEKAYMLEALNRPHGLRSKFIEKSTLIPSVAFSQMFLKNSNDATIQE